MLFACDAPAPPTSLICAACIDFMNINKLLINLTMSELIHIEYDDVVVFNLREHEMYQIAGFPSYCGAKSLLQPQPQPQQ